MICKLCKRFRYSYEKALHLSDGWVGAKTRGRLFYASYPGTQGVLRSGEIFPLTIMLEEDSKDKYQAAFLEDYEADPTVAQHAKLDALRRIKLVIDKGEVNE